MFIVVSQTRGVVPGEQNEQREVREQPELIQQERDELRRKVQRLIALLLVSGWGRERTA